ncbi:MFS transporter [Cohnella fermenti]|uniref:MFS transporter n=1 Tax=Cohnella fermenti TaxID=2565925 RepID=A0A4S4C9Y2_9BACL|nr:MFS transporter [Cohnella fermenti]THF84196.1 MFS transporter [Cohnella fermenti]
MNKQRPSSPSRGRFDGQTWLLLVVNGLFVTAQALSGTFLGVYLWKASGNFVLLGWFTLIGHACMALTFWLAGHEVKRGRKMTVLRLGIASSAVFYSLVLLFGAGAIQYIWLLGIVQGLAAGLFWLAFNTLYFEVTDADNRDRFNGFAGVFGALAGMIAPWCSGLVISRMQADSGYRVIFMTSLGIFAFGVVLSFFLRNRKPEDGYEWRHSLNVLQEAGTPWRKVVPALAAQGLRESVFGLMIGLLVYISTKSELQLGNFTLLTSGISSVSYFAVGRWLKPQWRVRGLFAGALVMSAAVIPFFLGIDFGIMLTFGIAVGLFIPFYMIPMTSAVFDLIGRDEASAKLRVEYIVLRELSLNAGRIVGMLAFIATVNLTRAPLALTAFLFVIGCSPLVSWLLMRPFLAGTARRTEKANPEPA